MAISKGDSCAMQNLVYMYKSTNLKYDKSYVIDYFLKINKPEKLKDIYFHDDCVIELLVDNYKLRKKNNDLEKEISDLKIHILASPEGELYFEAKKSWSACLAN